MIKKILNDLKYFISSMNEGAVDKIRGGAAVLESIETDLEKLLKNDPTFLDGPEGFIDYYSPHAEAQIKNKQLLLEKYIDQLMILKATRICIHRKQAYLDSLLKNKDENKSKIEEIKKDLTGLKNENNIERLMERKDIQREFKWIKKIGRDRRELKALDGKLDTEKATQAPRDGIRKNKLEKRIRDFDNDKYKIASLDPIQKQINGLQLKLDKHLRLKEKIPKGMIDVKRALSLQQELWSIQSIIEQKTESLRKLSEQHEENSAIPAAVKKLEQEIEVLREKETQLSTRKFSTSDEVDIKIKDMLKDLRSLMTISINGYKELAKSGGDIDVYLHQTTAYYWENLDLYRKTLSAINEYVQHHASQLTAEGGLVAECMSSAAEKIPKEIRINKALERVKQADKLSAKRVATYRENEANKVPDIRYFKQQALKLIEQLQPLPVNPMHIVKESKPFFFIPSNSNLYNIDHPAHTDLAGTLGNCYGETHMFLLRANQKNPTFNTICPQTDLINFQLDQTRQAGDLGIPKGKFEAKPCGLIRLSTSPTDMAKSDLEKMIKMTPTYAIHGTEIYYIDGELVIKKLNECADESNLGSIFPKETNSQRVARVDEIYTLETTTKHSQDQSMVKWDNIQSILTGSVDDTKNGEIYTIKLSGATTQPDANGKRIPFAHVLGFIHMKNPDPYKYIVYDYGLGPIGISSDEQLEAFFKYVLDYYPAFPEYVIKKIDDVSDECQNFFNGPDGIKPLSKKGEACERNIWNKARLLLLVKYSHGLDEVKMALEKIPLLKTKAQDEVYTALFANPEISFIDLLQTSIDCDNTEALKRLLNHPRFLTQNLSELMLGEINPMLSSAVAEWVSDGTISAQTAINVFRHNKDIVLAAFNKDPSAIQFTDIAVVIDLIASEKITFNQACEHYPDLKVENTIISFINSDKDFNPATVINVFYSNSNIAVAALNNIDPETRVNGKSFRMTLARQACTLLINDIKNLSDNNKEIEELDKRLSAIPEISGFNQLIREIEGLAEELKTKKEAMEKSARLEDDIASTDGESLSSVVDGERAALLGMLESLEPNDTSAKIEKNINLLIQLNAYYRALDRHDLYSTEMESIHKANHTSLLNAASKNEANEAKVPALLTLLASHPEYIGQYAEWVVSNKPIDVAELISLSDSRYGDNINRYMALVSMSDTDAPHDFYSLLEGGKTDEAERFYAYAIEKDGDILTRMKNDGGKLILSINALSSEFEGDGWRGTSSEIKQLIDNSDSRIQCFGLLSELESEAVRLTELASENKKQKELEASRASEAIVKGKLASIRDLSDEIRHLSVNLIDKKWIESADVILRSSQDTKNVDSLDENIRTLEVAKITLQDTIKNIETVKKGISTLEAIILSESDTLESLDKKIKLYSDIQSKYESLSTIIDVTGPLTNIHVRMNQAIALRETLVQKLDETSRLSSEISRLSDNLKDKSALALLDAILASPAESKNIVSLQECIDSLELEVKALQETQAKIDGINGQIRALTKPSINLNDAERRADQLGEKIQWYLEKKTMYESLNQLTDVTASLNEFRAKMQSDSGGNGQDAGQFDEFILLLSNNSEYRKSYVGLIESPHRMDLGILMKAHTQFGEKVVINAMDLTVKHGWDKAEIYLALKEKNQNATADTYCNGLMVHSTDYINDQRKNCLNYIEKISKAQFGTKDIKSNAYCESMKKHIESSLFDLSISNSDAILQELQAIHTAVTSPGMKAVQKQVERLEENARGMFGIGNQNKANNIRAAVCNVPLADRLHMLEPGNEASKPVGIALATHRKSFTNPLDKNGEVIKTKAADSYKNVFKELRDQSNDTDSTPSSRLKK